MVIIFLFLINTNQQLTIENCSPANAKDNAQSMKDNGFVLSHEGHPLQDMLDDEISY